MKKNKKIILIIAIIICIIILIWLNMDKLMPNELRIRRGYKIFGNDYCNGHSKEYAVAALAPWRCEICGYKDVHSNGAYPRICSKCASVTGRCMKCGKLEK